MDSVPQEVTLNSFTMFLTSIERDTITRYWSEMQAGYEEGDITLDMVLWRLLNNAILAKAVEYRIADMQQNGARHETA